MRISVFGKAQRVKLLDIHDAVSQVVDEITDCLFPEKEETRPQLEDRYFWRVEGEKFVSDEKEVQVDVEEVGNDREMQYARRPIGERSE